MLQGDAGLSDEELLTEYRNAELWDDAARLLVEMGRVDKAITLAFRRLTAPDQLTLFADQLIATGDPRRIEQAFSLIDDRLWEQRPRIQAMMSFFVPGCRSDTPSMAARRTPSRWPVPDSMPRPPN